MNSKTDTRARHAIMAAPAIVCNKSFVVWCRSHASSWFVWLFSLFAVVTLSACSTPSLTGQRHQRADVAVIGISVRSGLNVAINRKLLARDFTQLLSGRAGMSVLPNSLVRQYTGPARLDDLLARYAASGRIAPQDMQWLMAAGLPVRRALVARIESDQVTKLPVRRLAARNRNGAVLVDRERRILGTQRITRVSARLVDLHTGKLLWTQQFEVDPVVETVTTHYLGSSFSASLAAAFANTVVNGIKVDRYPETPSLRASLRSLLREVVKNLPAS